MGNWDEVTIKTEFMKDILSKILNKALKGKSGCDITVQVNALHLENKDGKVHVQLGADAQISTEELEKLLGNIV